MLASERTNASYLYPSALPSRHAGIVLGRLRNMEFGLLIVRQPGSTIHQPAACHREFAASDIGSRCYVCRILVRSDPNWSLLNSMSQLRWVGDLDAKPYLLTRRHLRGGHFELCFQLAILKSFSSLDPKIQLLK